MLLLMKKYVITLSKVFPSTHPRAGEPTMFSKNAFRWPSVTDEPGTFYKIHTIRANYEFWRKRFEKIAAGEAFLSVREWVGKPYGKGSTQREIARLTREDGIGLQKLSFFKDRDGMTSLKFFEVDGAHVDGSLLSSNDGLSLEDWRNWFRDYDFSKPMAIIHFTKYRYEPNKK